MKNKTAAKLTSEIENQANCLASMVSLIEQNAEHFNRFEMASASLLSGKPWFTLHHPESEQQVKEFCRAVGGKWFESVRDGGEIIYERESSDGLSVTIFDVRRPSRMEVVL